MNDTTHPAFPNHWSKWGCSHGISLRDYFAATAPLTLVDAKDYARQQARPSSTVGELVDWLSQMNVLYADAMLKARGQ